MGSSHSTANDSYAQTYGGYGGYGGPVAAGAGLYPGAAGAYPGATGAFPATSGAFPTAVGGFPGTPGAFPTAAGGFPATAGAAGAFPGAPGVYPSMFPGTLASPALYGPPIAATAYGEPESPKSPKKGRTPKESKYLDKEWAERVQAENALAYGNYAGATWHDARADRWGVKADKKHFRAWNKGAMASPYAFHPIPPAAGVAAVQPGVYAPRHATTVGHTDAVAVGFSGAPGMASPGMAYPGAAYPGATMMPQAGAMANPFYGF